MDDDRPPRDAPIEDLPARLARVHPSPLPYADQVWIGARLLTALTCVARALVELERPGALRPRIADPVREAQDCLQDIGAVLRETDQMPRS